MKNLIVRKAKKKDLSSILTLIKELAEYERAPEEVKVTLKEMERYGFGKDKIYHCLVAEIPENDKKGTERNAAAHSGPGIVGIAVYYIKYSTWKGRCLYLDDIIVTQSMRGSGIGKKLFDEVIVAAKKIRARKLEWQVLNWNEPAIGFYKKYSTVFDDEWLNCKLVFE